MYGDQRMHYVQKDIILGLARRSPQRFSELQPARIPNNTFSYHLKKLLESGYVSATATGYVATRKALKMVMLNDDGPRPKRTITPALITALYVTNQKGDVLLLRRRNQPFAEWYGIPSGLVHAGETLESAAYRELLEKTSIEASSGLKFAGVLDFRYLEHTSRDMFVHAVAFVYSYKYEGNKKLEPISDRFGEISWSNLDQAKLLPEVHAVAKLVEAGRHTVKSIDYDEPT